MAYGSESVRRVDKIVGPGNIFVVLAKRAVYGAVDIEALPGPTETLVIADGKPTRAWWQPICWPRPSTTRWPARSC